MFKKYFFGVKQYKVYCKAFTIHPIPIIKKIFMNIKKVLPSLCIILIVNISLYAQHTADIFIQETTGIGFSKAGGTEYVQSELLITTSTRLTELLSLELCSIIVDQ